MEFVGLGAIYFVSAVAKRIFKHNREYFIPRDQAPQYGIDDQE